MKRIVLTLVGLLAVALTAPAAAEHAPKRIGDSITLKGLSGERIRVKVIRVVDPATGGEFDEPKAAHRYVGVYVQLKNVGRKAYRDSPSNSGTLVTTGDKEAASALIAEGECSGEFGGSVRLSPGSKRRGCLPFEVRDGRDPQEFQFALNSGFADDFGEWRLR